MTFTLECSMNYKNYLDNLATDFIELLYRHGNPHPYPTEDFGWDNWRYSLEGYFRYAHIERYSDDKIEVLHVTTYPYVTCGEPIFGFDVICVESKVVGIYMDFSPILIDYGNFTKDINIKNNKPLPEWASIFSDYFVRFSPQDDEEFINFCKWVLNKYEWYLHKLKNRIFINDRNISRSVVELQNEYSRVQQNNPRTFNILKKKLGEEKATYFMNTILFPTYNENANEQP